MNDDKGLVFGVLFNGNGGGKELSWEGLTSWTPEKGTLWIHLNYENPQAQKWLSEDSGLPSIIIQALTEEETRPRNVPVENGLMLILRGVNMNPGADPEDMVSLRLWIEKDRIISMRHRKVMAIADIRGEFSQGNGPSNTGEFLVELIDRLLSRMGTVLMDIEEEVASFEDEVLSAENYELRVRIGETRRKAIRIRRYLLPQREVTVNLQHEKVSWLEESQRLHLRELADRITRYVEDLDSSKDRAALAKDELEARLAEQTNKTMYVLSIVAAIFLPLGLLTGLLGINVGGIPGTENEWAFTIVCVLLVFIAIFLGWRFKKMKWI